MKEDVEQVIEKVSKAKTLKEIPKLKKLKGYKISYRIKVGDYRIGVTIEGNLVTIVRCLLRKDFYSVFP